MGKSPQIPQHLPSSTAFLVVQLSKCLSDIEPHSLTQHWILIDKGSIPEVATVFL